MTLVEFGSWFFQFGSPHVKMVSARALKVKLLTSWSVTVEENNSFLKLLQSERLARTQKDRDYVHFEIDRTALLPIRYKKAFEWNIPDNFSYTDVEEYTQYVLNHGFVLAFIQSPDLKFDSISFVPKRPDSQTFPVMTQTAPTLLTDVFS